MIIEFAKDLQAEGKGVIEAALEAAPPALPPIIMTSLAFILGVVPLVMASGASSASQRAIGTGVIGGMITGTVLAVVFVPVFFRAWCAASSRAANANAGPTPAHAASRRQESETIDDLSLLSLLATAAAAWPAARWCPTTSALPLLSCGLPHYWCQRRPPRKASASCASALGGTIFTDARLQQLVRLGAGRTTATCGWPR